jgi:hypothetical protein
VRIPVIQGVIERRILANYRIDAETGNVFTAPVDSGGGRTVVFEVMPTGCARMHRR